MIVRQVNRIRPCVEVGSGTHPINLRVAGLLLTMTSKEACRLADDLVDAVEREGK